MRHAVLLRQLFKQMFLKKLLRVIELEELRWGQESIDSPGIFPKIRSMYKTIKRKKWTVRIENPVLGLEQIIEYLARYVRRVAITNSRIEEVTKEKVVINYKQYTLQKKGKPPPIGKREFEGARFIQQFTQHFMPRGFHKVRYYGFYAFGAKKVKARIEQQLTGQPPKPYQQATKREIIKKMLGLDADVCTNCGAFHAFVTKSIIKDISQIFILTRVGGIAPIRAGPGKVKLQKVLVF